MIKYYKIPEQFEINYEDRLLYLQENWKIFRDECLELSQEIFKEYKTFANFSTRKNSWTVYTMYYKNYKYFFNKHCKKSLKLLREVSPVNAGFSKFEPNTTTTLHKGRTPYTYRCHLGLVVPDFANFFIEGNNLTVNEGEISLFPSELEHQAWNRSLQNRYILILDFIKSGYSKDLVYKNFAEKSILRLGDFI